ncbi:PIN domain-like protein [Punctularia strigosozonata HHB-11173 SS5]|uniref:PIN domain-like protein n=1 Tax=Punctularia strigosozonata (strain HHB-11173) TaxID=741275 RepID=UPI0004416361|nr:PIN domain-like protein [Punctularia strigosozonata HHB-11173 SS5]EIN08410.1 PIN domain-like protein [Punctularia strigosozonata HHB-11173 SS5]
MGVLGLAPFIQKAYPEVARTFPARLRELAGKTLAIDGTLVTQRMHFAPAPHPYRHVLGWYRLAQELRENGVRAICVFDGLERSAAKQNELERRREIRRIDRVRASIEAGRVRRLHQLRAILRLASDLSPSERHRIIEALRQIRLSGEPFDPALPVADLAEDGFDREEILNAFYESMSIGPKRQISVPAHHEEAFPVSRAVPANLDDLRSALSDLYLDFRASVSNLRSTSSVPSSPTQSQSEDDDIQASQNMSKNQQKLAAEEDEVWNSLTLDSVVAPLQIEQDLGSLWHRSQSISESYKRRSNPPTSETYEQCKEILRASGIPCIETRGAFEAEALASALVLSGRADYVASEDTDVLIYEAPLLRNITSRNVPLSLLSGSDVRSVLSLTRSSYIDFALLLGTDFSQRIKNVGPARALRFIRSYGSIEQILKHEGETYPPRTPVPEYLAQVAMGRAVFETLPPLPDEGLLVNAAEDEKTVHGIMMKYGLGREIRESPEVDYEYTDALAGNYFGDDPTAL